MSTPTQSADQTPPGDVRRSKLKVLRSAPALAVASRALVALGGGYALAAFFTTTVALLARAPREEAAYLGAVPSFLVLAGAIVWAFTARTVLRAWLGILIPLLALAATTAWLSRAAAP